MSKMIKLTQEYLDEIRKDFESSLRDIKITDGKISYTKTFGYINRKAKVYFTETAWLKMQALISEFSTEVAWHGIAYRGSDETKDEYFITDILVYPQEVTGGTVNTDQEKYEMWLMEHDDDVFNNMRMQGHSHVNMSTTPSSVDITHQEKILAQLDDDMFYIFMIWNKKGDKTIKIYDLLKNVLFDGTDVSVDIQDDGTGIYSFIDDAKKMVENKISAAKSNTYSSNGYYNGYYGGFYDDGLGFYEVQSSKDIPAKKDESQSNKRKGKRKFTEHQLDLFQRKS